LTESDEKKREGNHDILRHERLSDERFFSGSQNVGFPTVVRTAIPAADQIERDLLVERTLGEGA
jgi:hypothetical protein